MFVLREFYLVPTPDENGKCRFLPCMSEINSSMQKSLFKILYFKLKPEKNYETAPYNLFFSPLLSQQAY